MNSKFSFKKMNQLVNSEPYLKHAISFLSGDKEKQLRSLYENYVLNDRRLYKKYSGVISFDKSVGRLSLKEFFVSEENINGEEITGVELMAQDVLDQHLEMNRDEFDDTLMPDEKLLPTQSDAYHRIKELVIQALEDGNETIAEI